MAMLPARLLLQQQGHTQGHLRLTLYPAHSDTAPSTGGQGPWSMPSLRVQAQDPVISGVRAAQLARSANPFLMAGPREAPSGPLGPRGLPQTGGRFENEDQRLIRSLSSETPLTADSPAAPGPSPAAAACAALPSAVSTR